MLEKIELDGQNFADFAINWVRSEKLFSILDNIPQNLILKFGLTERRKSLLERWGNLESPGLDGLVREESFKLLSQWNRDAESLIAFVSNNRKDYIISKNYETNLEIIENIEESDFVTNDWCWPWHKRVNQVPEKPKWSREKVVKFGVVASLGLAAIVTCLDEE